MDGIVDLGGLGWDEVVDRLASRGWIRLVRAVPPAALADLEQAAPGSWSSLPPT